jgi:hypothetical protein
LSASCEAAPREELLRERIRPSRDRDTMAHMLCYLASSQEIVTEYETAIDFSTHTFAR